MKMKRIILFLVLACVASCTSTKTIYDRDLVGIWSYARGDGLTTYFEFRSDKSGTYGVGKSLLECDCGHEFTWSKVGNIISTVGYDGLEVDGEYQEVIVQIELVGIHKNGQLAKLKPRHNDYHLVKNE